MTAPDPMTAPGSVRTQCTATSKQTGRRCGARAIAGGTVCRWHGGAAPQVQAAARERLKALAPVAVQTLERLMEREEYPTTQLGASRTVLEYAEGKPTESIEITQKRPDLSKLSEAELGQLEALLARATTATGDDDEEPAPVH